MQCFFSFQKGSSGQNHSLSDSHHPMEKSTLTNFPSPYPLILFGKPWAKDQVCYLNIFEKSNGSLFLYWLLETMKLLYQSVICYFHYLKSIPNDNSFKEQINSALFINLNYSIVKNVYLFRLVGFKINAIIKSKFIVPIGCHKQPLEAFTERCPWNQLKWENIEISYLVKALKEPLQID